MRFLMPPVVITEGEKAADAARAALGKAYVVVATVYGASGTPSAQALAHLRGRTVILWPDASPKGKSHVDRIATALAGIAAEVRVVEPPPDAPEEWDAADASADQVRELVATAQPLKPSASEPSPNQFFGEHGLLLETLGRLIAEEGHIRRGEDERL
jgi:hypothetical protein